MRQILCRQRDATKLAADVVEMRERIAQSRPGEGEWDVKDRRGGLVDAEFVAQTLQLKHAAEHPQILDVSAEGVFRSAGKAGLLDGDRAERLSKATRRFRAVQGFLRLTAGQEFDETTAPEGLRSALARAAETESFADLKAVLAEDYECVRTAFTDLIESKQT